MIKHGVKGLPLARQCALLEVARSSVYRKPKEGGQRQDPLMRRMDELYTRHPFYGSRQMTAALRREGMVVNRKRVRRLMALMGLRAQCPGPNLSKPAPGHKTYPYLLRNYQTSRPNEVWCTDITYLRMEKGFLYLTAIMDWHSRKVLAWELSNSLDPSFCLRALESAIQTHGKPTIMNTDQGSQYTSDDWVKALNAHKIKISMDGKGRALDNIFVERLWRSVKYEEVYLREYQNALEMRHHLETYFHFYNHTRPHSSLGGQSPAQVHPALKPTPDRRGLIAAPCTPLGEHNPRSSETKRLCA